MCICIPLQLQIGDLCSNLGYLAEFLEVEVNKIAVFTSLSQLVRGRKKWKLSWWDGSCLCAEARVLHIEQLEKRISKEKVEVTHGESLAWFVKSSRDTFEVELADASIVMTRSVREREHFEFWKICKVSLEGSCD